jgi:hypothetical protein
MSRELITTVVHARSSERDRRLFARPSQYSVTIAPALHDVREVRLRQALIPRTDMRVAEGTIRVYVDRVVKKDVRTAFVTSSILVYTLSSPDSIWQVYSYADIDSPLLERVVDDAVINGAIDAFMTTRNDAVVFAYSVANRIQLKVFTPPSSLLTTATDPTPIGTATARAGSVVVRPSLAPGRVYYAYVDVETRLAHVGFASAYAQAIVQVFRLNADSKLALALGKKNVAGLVDAMATWASCPVGTRAVAIVFRESIAVYVSLDGDGEVETGATIETVKAPLNVRNVTDVLGIVRAFGAQTRAQIVSTAYALGIALLSDTLVALDTLADEHALGLVTEAAVLNVLADAQTRQTALELAAAQKDAAAAQGYYEPIGGYGNARFKLVTSAIYQGDAIYGATHAGARVLDASRRGILIRESGWLKTVDNVDIWDASVASMAERRLVRFFADVPIAARYVKYATDTATTSSDRAVALIIGASSQDVRFWKAHTNLVELTHTYGDWPPVCAVPSSDHRELDMLLFAARRAAWVNGVVYQVHGEGNVALASATLQPGARLLAARTSGTIYAFAERTGQFFELESDSASAIISMRLMHASALSGVQLPTNTDVANAVLVPPGLRSFMIGVGDRVQLYAPNYKYDVRAGAHVTVYVTNRIPSALARQDVDTAVFGDALGLTQIRLDNHNVYDRLAVDQGGDNLDTITLPFLGWSNPCAFVTAGGDFFVLRPSSEELIYAERTTGEKPLLAIGSVAAHWRERDGAITVLATASGIYRVELVAEDLVTDRVRLAVLRTDNGATESVLAENLPSDTEILTVYDRGIILKMPEPDASVYMYDTMGTAQTGTLLASRDELGPFDQFIPFGPNAWMRGNLTHVSIGVGSAPRRTFTTPVTITNVTLRTTAYARIGNEHAPQGMANVYVGMGSSGDTSKIAVFSADSPTPVYTSAVDLGDILAGGFATIAVVDAQVAITYRTRVGGIGTAIVPLPYKAPAFQQDTQIAYAQPSHVAMVTWSKFNRNTLSEAALVYSEGTELAMLGDIRYEATGRLVIGTPLDIEVANDGNIDFLCSQPVYVSGDDVSGNALVSGFAVIHGASGNAYVTVCSRDEVDWLEHMPSRRFATGVTLMSASSDDGNTIYVSALNRAAARLCVFELSGLVPSTGFASIRQHPQPTTTAEVVEATPHALYPQFAHVVGMHAAGECVIAYIDDTGARIARRRLLAFDAVPYTIALNASQGRVADTLADLMFAVDVQFFVSSGSSTDDTLSLNVSHALVPFALDLRHDPVLGAVLGWRDPHMLFVASQSLAAQVGGTAADMLDQGALERVFSLADGDSDGQLTTAELLAIVNLPLTQIASTIDARIIAALENVLQSLALTATFDALALASMRILDPDKTGTVNVNEFTQFVTAFVRNGHSVRSPGNIDEGGTRLIDLFMSIDGRDAISQHGEAAHRPFTLLFLNVERGDMAIYQANDFPAFVRFDPPKQTLSTMEFEFFNARLNRQYDFKGLENQLIFEIDHGRRSTASERSRAPDGTYTLLPHVSNVPPGRNGALQQARARTMLSTTSEYDDDELASSPYSSESSDYEDGM